MKKKKVEKKDLNWNDLEAVFYDRKNDREVTNRQLCPINFVQDLAVIDDQERSMKYPIHGCFTLKLGEFGYKSENCDSFRNWDLWTTLNDLVFLRFDAIDGKDKKGTYLLKKRK